MIMIPVPERLSIAEYKKSNEELTVHWFELQSVKKLDGGEQKRQRLSRTSPSGTQDILSCKQHRYRFFLNLCHGFETHLFKCSDSGL